MRIRSGGVVTCVLLLAACGSTTQERVATGGLTGAGIGALAGGPIGALIGGGVGSVAGWVTPKSADDMAVAMIKSTREMVSPPVASGSGQSGTAGSGGSGTAQSTPASHAARSSDMTNLPISTEAAKQVQTNLRSEGYYQGPIDGIVGPQTKRALASYQGQHGLPKTSALDTETLQMLTSASPSNAVGSTSPSIDAQPDNAGGSAPRNQDLPPPSQPASGSPTR